MLLPEEPVPMATDDEFADTAKALQRLLRPKPGQEID